MNDFKVVGVRRMVVAMFAIATIGAVHVLAPDGINQPASIGIAGVTLGYYGSKFAEAIKSFFESRKV